jgi:hypothetical protein
LNKKLQWNKINTDFNTDFKGRRLIPVAKKNRYKYVFAKVGRLTRHAYDLCYLTIWHFLCSAVLIFSMLVAPSIALAQLIGDQGTTSERRIALVIGNSHYDYVESLANPVNDIAAMETSLRELGFEVFVGKDLTLQQFKDLASKFKTEAQSASAVLVYYSGHGFQLEGQNFLVPSDASLKTKGSIATETVRLETVIADVQGKNRQVLVFLDACRNNPLPASQRQGEGLAQITTGNDMFVAFATQPGNISYDGRSTLSPFTKAIVKHLGYQGQSVSDMMISVRNEVEKATLYQQTPWDQSSLKRQFYFKPNADRPINNDTQTNNLASATLPGSDLDTQMRSTSIDNSIGYVAIPSVETSALPNSNIIVLPETPVEIFGREDLIQTMQNELKRVGCYRADLDAAWGTGSRDALVEYYKTKKLKPFDTEPTEFHLKNLQTETGVVCKYQPPKIPQAKEASKTPSVILSVRPTIRKGTQKEARNIRPSRAKGTQAANVSNFKPARTPASVPLKKKPSLADATLLGGFR